MRSFLTQKTLISLHHGSGHSNTTRTKSYKNGCSSLDLGSFNEIIHIDPHKRIAIVEPRVTMEELVKTTLRYGLIPPVLPEFKGITVGGAIMGGAAESGSHRWGGFHDTCLSFEILCGNGDVIKASPNENQDLFYGAPCSYGTLGTLLSIEIQLIDAKDIVHLRYHRCSSMKQAIEVLQSHMHASAPPDFLDGIVYSKDSAVIIEGSLRKKSDVKLPIFSLKPSHSEWYFQHVENMESDEEAMSVQDYLFRYDQGAFWVGAYLFRPQFLSRFIFQGILHLSRKNHFTESEIQKLHRPPRPNAFWRALTHPLMTSQRLWKLQHMAEKWVQSHAIIQDFCIPEDNALRFLEEVVGDPGTFPLWLCPIKSSHKPQILAPHFSKDSTLTHFINVGIYGLPAYYGSIEQITKKLEQKTHFYGGRKVFYSRSFYTEEEFWKIYPRQDYELLRAKTSAKGIWHEITEKVLSE